MKIALVHEMLVKLGGAERVARKLTQLFPKAPLYTLLYDKKTTGKWFNSIDVRAANLPGWLPRKFLLPLMSQAIERFDFKDFDVVISSNSAFAHGVKTNQGARHVCYCHSPMRYAWDFSHEYTREYSKLGRWLIAHLLHPIRQWDYLAAERADVILANSRHTQKRIAKYWRKPSEVVYPPVDVKRFKPCAAHDDFFLIVSALTPFKRIDLAVQTFNQNKRRLVIIGDGAQRGHLESMAGSNIEFHGRKSDDEVREYYQRCRALIFPGEEDFGITPVEAMAAGKPVLAYGVGGVTESVEAGVSGEFFEKPTAESLQAGLEKLLANEKHYDHQKIRQSAERFDEAIFEDKIKRTISF